MTKINVAQLVRAQDSGSWGYRFDSDHLQFKQTILKSSKLNAQSVKFLKGGRSESIDARQIKSKRAAFKVNWKPSPMLAAREIALSLRHARRFRQEATVKGLIL